MSTFSMISVAAAIAVSALAGCAQQPTAQAKGPMAQGCPGGAMPMMGEQGKDGMPMPMATGASAPMQGGQMPMAMGEGCPAGAKAKP